MASYSDKPETSAWGAENTNDKSINLILIGFGALLLLGLGIFVVDAVEDYATRKPAIKEIPPLKWPPDGTEPSGPRPDLGATPGSAW